MKFKLLITQNGIQVILTGLCVILCYLLWIETRPIEITSLSNGFKEIETINEDTLVFPSIENTIPNINEFDEMINRPLFSENRQPFVYEEPELTPEKQKPNTKKSREEYSLNAVIITPDKKIAIIQSSKAKELQRLTLDETIDDWKLEDINPREIKLTNGKETKTLVLEVKNSVPSKTAPKTNTKKRMRNQEQNRKTSSNSPDSNDPKLVEIEKTDKETPNGLDSETEIDENLDKNQKSR